MTTVRILIGDALTRLRELPDESVHCVVTSPPYWGLRDYGVAGQIGLEDTLEDFLDRLAAVFVEVKRVLRKDGTAWVNMGDSYASDAFGGGIANADFARKGAARAARTRVTVPEGLKPKDLVGQPWRLAFRLQADGWYWRSAIVWHKPAPMPESCKDRPTSSWEPVLLFAKRERYFYDAEAIKEPCAAPDSNKPDDWERAVNRRRQTTATQRQGLYKTAAREEALLRPSFGRGAGWREHEREVKRRNPRPGIDEKGGGQGSGSMTYPTDSRNRRNVWTIPSRPFNEAHFATFPPELVEPCIRAGTSERGCCAECGAPRRRIVTREFRTQKDVSATRSVRGAAGQKPLDASNNRQGTPRGVTATGTVGWEHGCDCGGVDAPCVILDPFFGAGTTGLVAAKLCHDCIGIELNPAYAEIAERRIRNECGLLTEVDVHGRETA